MDKVNRENNDKHYANWVNSTHDKIQNKGKEQLVKQYEEMHQRTVEERRERLVALLAAEQEEYFAALDNMVETQDQRKQRLAAAALELKQRRESKREQVAKEKLDQAFRENCDPLRAALSKQNTVQVAAERQQQLLWNEARRHEEREDDLIFDEMWEQERLKKVQRAQEDMERAKTMNEKLRVQLKAQKDAFDTVKRREEELRLEQDLLYKEQVEHQLKYDAQKEAERRAEAVALGRSNRQYNDMLRAEKDEQQRQKRAAAQQELDELLAKIQEEEEADARMKVQRQQATKKYMDELREHMGTEAANEAEMEHLWQQENEKEWAKREAKWQAEQDVRDNLLRQVFEERAVQLQRKMALLGEEARQKKIDKENLLQQMEAAAKVEADKEAKRRMLLEDAKLDIDRQIALRQANRESAKREMEMEKAQSAVAEENFKLRVQQELEAVEAKTRAIRSGRTAASRPF